MSALVIVESLFGNTLTVGEAIADGLRSAGLDTELTDISHAPQASSVTAELVVLGAPTHAFSLSRPTTRDDAVRQGAPAERATKGLREWLADARLDPPRQAPSVAEFDTRVDKVRHLPGSAARKAARLGRRAGLHPDLGSESFYVEDVQGPLLDGELDRARAWGRTLATQVATGPSDG